MVLITAPVHMSSVTFMRVSLNHTLTGAVKMYPFDRQWKKLRFHINREPGQQQQSETYKMVRQMDADERHKDAL